MRPTTVASYGITAVIALAIGYFIHALTGHGGPGPIDDHNPVGFNLSTPAPATNATPAPVLLSSSNLSQGCAGSNVHCYVTIQYVRTNPQPCNTGDPDLSCQPPKCPPSGACYLFTGPVSISHIDPKLRHHTVDQISQAAGMIVLERKP